MKRYVIYTSPRVVKKWTIIFLTILTGTFVIWCILDLVNDKFFDTSASKDDSATKPIKTKIACIVLGAIHIGMLMYTLLVIRFENNEYLRQLNTLGRFLKKLVDTRDAKNLQIPLGFVELYNRIVDRVAAGRQLSSRQDAKLAMQKMTPIELAYYFRVGVDQDVQLILPDFNCRLLYSQCEVGSPPRCIDKNQAQCTNPNASSPIIAFFNYQEPSDTTLDRINELYKTILLLRDQTYADPDRLIDRRMFFLRLYLYSLLLLVGGWVFHQTYKTWDEMSICVLVILVVLMIIYTGAYMM